MSDISSFVPWSQFLETSEVRNHGYMLKFKFCISEYSNVQNQPVQIYHKIEKMH